MTTLTISKNPRPKDSRRTRRGSLSKAKILAASTRMFADEGYAAVSIRDIADACNVNAPTIYHFFGDKETLFAECCSAIFGSTARRLHASLVSAHPPRDRIKRFTVTLSRILLKNHDFRRLLQREILVDERREYGRLATHFFVEEFALLVAEIAKLEDMDLADAKEHAFSIYALTFGLIQLRRTAAAAGVDGRAQSNPERLALRVLHIVLPEQKWKS